MADKDREAMLQAYDHERAKPNYNCEAFSFEIGWQAARDLYAPKLTFMKAVKIAAKGIGVGGATGYAVKAISALEAAGIKFQHEVYD